MLKFYLYLNETLSGSVACTGGRSKHTYCYIGYYKYAGLAELSYRLVMHAKRNILLTKDTNDCAKKCRGGWLNKDLSFTNGKNEIYKMPSAYIHSFSVCLRTHDRE